MFHEHSTRAKRKKINMYHNFSCPIFPMYCSRLLFYSRVILYIFYIYDSLSFLFFKRITQRVSIRKTCANKKLKQKIMLCMKSFMQIIWSLSKSILWRSSLFLLIGHSVAHWFVLCSFEFKIFVLNLVFFVQESSESLKDILFPFFQ